ncbi:hypothetical protein BKA82DRAFT_4349054 [Pisolithus tinctorius]|nr:hypothetical protein BKA82DRAFT_4349054 [Pisolithus tinctorius]
MSDKLQEEHIRALQKLEHNEEEVDSTDDMEVPGAFLWVGCFSDVGSDDEASDVEPHSAIKWIGGHGTTIAGVVIDLGKFDSTRSGGFSLFTEPFESYHGLVFNESYGSSAFAVKLRVDLMRDIGSTQPLRRLPTNPRP